jgi:hypothetical protein
MLAVSCIPATDIARLAESAMLVCKFFHKLNSVLYSLYKVRDHTVLGRWKVSEETDHGMFPVLQNWKGENEETALAEPRRKKIQTRELQKMKQNLQHIHSGSL